MRGKTEAACLLLAMMMLCVACIVLQPTDQTVVEGQTATFTVSTSGAGATTYQWERSDDNGATWASISGATGAYYVTPPTTLADDGARFRVVVTDDDGVQTSAAATLTVTMSPPQIAAHPSDQTVLEGQSATFAVTASGSGTISYQWERSDDNGATWSTVPGATSPSYVTPASTLADDSAQFLCVVSNEAGSVRSQPATLTVEPSYGGWWEVYLDVVPLEPLCALEFQHTGTTVRYLNIVLALAGNVIYGVNGGGVGFDLTVVDHDNLQGTLIIGGSLMSVTLMRRPPSGTQSAQGDFDFASITSYACAGVDGSDVYFASVDHMGCDRSVMVEIEAWSAPLLPGTYVVGDEVDVGIHIEDIVGGQYAYYSYIAVGGSITFTAIDTTRVAGRYAITTLLGETITGSFDVPVFVIWF